jgi:hypothetical protein
MLPAYSAWIDVYLAQHGKTAAEAALGRCRQATRAMVASFTELRRVRGHVETSWGRCSHWWCETSDGEIVDPTAAQFSAIWCYEEWKLGDEIAIGTCQHCGEEIMARVESLDDPEPAHRIHCSDQCLRAAVAALHNGW